MRVVSVPMRDEAMDRLRELARLERRRPQDQAAVLLELAIQAAGVRKVDRDALKDAQEAMERGAGQRMEALRRDLEVAQETMTAGAERRLAELRNLIPGGDHGKEERLAQAAEAAQGDQAVETEEAAGAAGAAGAEVRGERNRE